MLPPRGLAAGRRTALTPPRHTTTCSLLPSHATSSVRTFWSWRSGRNEYTSHLDPLYARFTRFRTLQTRAKLLEKLKRRGKFEWDLDQRPFFTPKQGLRAASHIPFHGSRFPLPASRSQEPSATSEQPRKDGRNA
ncbi:hypothetical protein LTR53_005850 [Teratosphaeriaceae sp. CCFEE 6253]|nr:hypothetical protein LTR53_005850 [Teratosphaeriaceae sp. CCFEE 6253]